jgi:FkbM family methyltransferase
VAQGLRHAEPRGGPATWTRSLLSPRERFLPGLGARLARRPQIAAGTLIALRAVPLGRVRGLVLRNVSTPLVRRMDTWLEVPVDGGFRLRLDASDVGCEGLLVSGKYEPQVTALFRKVLKEGDVCVDAGAHVGYFTLLAATIVGETGRVYAFEPDPATHRILRANVELNEAANVSAFAAAAGAEDGEAVLHTVPPGNSGRASLRPADVVRAGRVPVPVRRLATAVPAAELPRLRLVKIDVEGAEADVLHGLEPAFEAGARPAVIVELHPAWWDDDTAAYLTEFCNRLRLVPWTLRIEAPTDRGRYVPTRFDAMQRHPEHVLLVPRSVADGGA